MKTVVALSCLLSISMAAVLPDLPDDWLSFKAKYNKSYDGDVDALRSKIFQQNVNKINLHNRKFEDGLVTYFLGVNHFADMLESEVSEKWTGYNKGFLSEPRMSTPYEPSNRTLPSSVDWRKKGAVTPVKNQGSCGSCWTFSAVGALEGQNAIKTGKLVSLSEEQLVECDKGAKGCNGGDPPQAFEYLKSAGGIETEKSYPYTSGHDGNVGPCKFNRSKVAVHVTGYKKIRHDDENALQDAVANIGPISIAIAVTLEFALYQGGVLCGFGCDASIVCHAVVIVGYGEDPKYGPYWLIKNSWGERWGDDGYVKVCRNQDNELCVAFDANVPTV